jgi:MoaA/NifB/PqqE/SkfB family radical SAM enzyme
MMAGVQSVVRNEDQVCCYRSINSDGRRALWEIVRACNLKCDFCLVPDGSFGLPLATTARIAHELIAAGVGKIMLSGGEPLLYKPIDRIIEYLADAGALVKILTNGTVHRPEIFSLIDRYGSIEVSVSMESARREVNNRIFGREWAHDRILATVERVPPARLHLNVVCSSLNRDEIPELIDWAAEKRLGSLSLINIFQNPATAGRFVDDCAVHRLSDAEQDKILELVRRKRREHEGRLAIRTLNFTSTSGCETCGAGRSVIYIDAEGAILPCTLTDNTWFHAATRGMTVGQALEFFASRIDGLPASHCAGKLQALAAAARGGAQ